MAHAEVHPAAHRAQRGQVMTYSRLAATSLAATLLVFSGSLVAQQKEIAFDSAGDFLNCRPTSILGEVAGVATTSTGNLWVYNQGGGPTHRWRRAPPPSGGARLLEFDRSGKFLREIGSTNEERPYGFRWPRASGSIPRTTSGSWTAAPGCHQVRPVRPRPHDPGPNGPRRSVKSAAARVAVWRWWPRRRRCR